MHATLLCVRNINAIEDQYQQINGVLVKPSQPKEREREFNFFQCLNRFIRHNSVINCKQMSHYARDAERDKARTGITHCHSNELTTASFFACAENSMR